MIVRRLVENLKQRDWATVGLELVVVVLGVFLGLQAQAWYEERGRRDLEAACTERLHDDVVALQERRAPLLAFRDQWNTGLKSLSATLYEGVARTATATECRGLALSYAVTNPTDDLASLVELQSAGGLTLFRNARVSTAIQDFLLTRARARDSQAGVARVMPMIALAHPDLIRVVAPSEVDGDPPEPGSFDCDVAGMLADPGFLSTFEVAQANYGFHMRDNREVSASLAALHAVLDETLGLTHE